MRQFFRPVYGRYIEIRPKRWWSPKERKTARLAARVSDYFWEMEHDHHPDGIRRAIPPEYLP